MSRARTRNGSINVPVVDLTGWISGSAAGRQTVAAAVDAAASDIGFLQVVGHGVPAGAVTGLTTAMDAFFRQPPEDKVTWCAPPHVNRGYTPPKAESLSRSLGIYAPSDLFEAFNVGSQASDFPHLDLPGEHYPANIWPRRPPSFADAVGTWFGEAGRVARILTDIFAAALGLPAGFFTAYTSHSIDTLRMNNYQLPPFDAVIEPDQVGMGAHTDYGIVTVLWADPVPGLQILGTDGRWYDVVPAPGALLVNLGDLLARWTDDRWISTMHRVLPPIGADGRPFRRRSAAFFHDGNADAVISTLPATARSGAGGEPARPGPYPAVTVADHLTAKLAGSRGGVLNTGAEREAARLRGASP